VVLLEVLEVRLEVLLLLLGGGLGLGGGDLLGSSVLLLVVLNLLLVLLALHTLCLGLSLLKLLGLSGGGLLISDEHGLEKELVVLGPLLQRELGDDEGSVVHALDLTLDGETSFAFTSLRDDVPGVTGVGRDHALKGLVVDHPAEVGNDVASREVGGVGGPSRTDSVASVDKNEGDDGHVEGGLNGESVIVEVSKELIVIRVEDGTGDLLELGKDVTRRGRVLSSHTAGSELTGGGKEVDVVGAAERLGHADDGTGKGHLSVMVSTVLSDISSELGDLDLSLELPLEAGEEDFPLGGLEAVVNVGDGPGVVGLGEEDELFVDKLGELDSLLLALGVVEEGVLLKVVEPDLPVVDAGLREGHVNKVATLFVVLELREVDLVDVEVGEVVLGLSRGGSTETLVVLNGPTLGVIVLLLPRLVLGEGEEGLVLLALSHLNNGGDELLEESLDVEEGRPEVVNEVDDKSLDVGSIVILISHDHEVPVTERLDVLLVVLNVELEAHDVDDVLDLIVGHNLLVVGLADVEGLTLEGEDTVEVAADNGEPGHGKGLGRVSLGDDEGTVLGLDASSVVGVVELGNSDELDLLGTTLPLELLSHLELGKSEDVLDDSRLVNLLEELGVKLALGAEGLGASSEAVLRLRVEGGVLNETVDEDAQVVLDLLGLNLASLVLLLDGLDEVGGNLVGNVRDVLSSLVGVDGVNEGNLLSAPVGGGDTDLPAVSDLLEGGRGGDSVVEVNVVLKGGNGEL